MSRTVALSRGPPHDAITGSCRFVVDALRRTVPLVDASGGGDQVGTCTTETLLSHVCLCRSSGRGTFRVTDGLVRRIRKGKVCHLCAHSRCIPT